MPRWPKQLSLLLTGVLLVCAQATPVRAEAVAAPSAQVVAADPVAPPSISALERRIQELEERLAALERLLALATIDVPALAEQTSPAVVSLYLVDEDLDVQSQGTGFLWTADGQIVTNAHVVEGAEQVLAKFANGEVEEAERILVDPFLDLAILDVAGEGYPYLGFAEGKPEVGSPVVVIGNAYGYSNSVTTGIVSGVDRPDPMHYWHYPSLQTDAAINHGNSGGPILNAKGEVVAVATWTEVKGETDGIAFGIPVDQIVTALDRYDPKRGIVRPWLGISVQEPYWTQGGLPNNLGLMVTDVHPLGAAAKGGLRPDDFILAVNEKPVNYLMELRFELEKSKPGDKITLTIDRYIDGEYVTRTITVTAGEYSSVVPPLIPAQFYFEETDDLF